MKCDEHLGFPNGCFGDFSEAKPKSSFRYLAPWNGDLYVFTQDVNTPIFKPPVLHLTDANLFQIKCAKVKSKKTTTPPLSNYPITCTHWAVFRLKLLACYKLFFYWSCTHRYSDLRHEYRIEHYSSYTWVTHNGWSLQKSEECLRACMMSVRASNDTVWQTDITTICHTEIEKTMECNLRPILST